MVSYDLRRNDAELYLVDEGKKDVKKNFQLANSVSSWVLKNLETITFNNLHKDKLPEGINVVHIDGTASREKSAIFVPIKLIGRPLGVLSVQHFKPNYYDDEDRQILELLANHIALALNNRRLLGGLRQLDKSGHKLTGKLDSSQDIIPAVVDSIEETTQADLITLYPYLQSEDKYLQPIERGVFLDNESLIAGEPTPAAIVHLVNSLNDPIFEDSTHLYTRLGKDYHTGGKFPDRGKIQSTAALPLKAGSERVGVLFINFRTKQRFDQAQQWVISSLATYAAIAIRNSRLVNELRERRSKELGGLQQIDRVISQILDLKENLQTILELTIEHIKADTGVILLHNKKLNAIVATAAIGEHLRPLEEQVFPLDQFQGIAKTAFETKTSIRINNVRTDPNWKDRFSENSPNTISEMDIPLVLADEAIGVMNFESGREAAFSQEDENFMKTLAGQAVIAIKNALDYQIAQRIAKEREALIDVVNTLLLQTDQKEIFSIILKKALEITGSSKGSINTCDYDRREFRIEAQSSLNPEWGNRVQSLDEGIIGRVVKEKRIIRINQISVDPLRTEFIEAFSGEEESELAVPILDGDEVVGVINLESENPYHFEEDDVELIKSLASLCAIALKNADIVHQKQLASIGLITGDIAHKMNSPLSKIRKQVELVQENCQEILAENGYLAEKIVQIDKMLSETLSMIQTTVNDAKRSFANIEKTSLKSCIKRALDQIGLPENISIEDQISTHRDRLYVLATPELANVFHNLISNARRAMPDGGKIFLAAETINERWIIISVEDTGKGIPVEVAPLVYSVSERGETGHGFGLPLTKAYVEMIGGIMDTPVSGRNGVGAKFTFRLRKA